MKPHIHAQLMLEYARDAKTLLQPWKIWQVTEGSRWASLLTHPTWSTNRLYRRIDDLPSNPGHPHADQMIEYAIDAGRVQKPWKLWQQFDGGHWVGLTTHPVWSRERQYRRSQGGPFELTNQLANQIENAIAENLPGFRNGWLNENKVIDLSTTVKNHHEVILNMDYILHPALPQGKFLGVLIDGKRRKPRIYIKSDSPLSDLTNPADVLVAYLKDNQ